MFPTMVKRKENRFEYINNFNRIIRTVMTFI